MALTPAQQAAVKADIIANADLDAFPNTSDGAFAIAVLYNLVAVPEFVVWRTNITTSEIKEVIDWVEVIASSVGERDTFQFMIADGSINGSDINVRQGIADIFSGPGGANSRAALTALAKRSATRIEALLSTGNGTTASPATMDREGTISYQDVYSARNS